MPRSIRARRSSTDMPTLNGASAVNGEGIAVRRAITISALPPLRWGCRAVCFGTRCAIGMVRSSSTQPTSSSSDRATLFRVATVTEMFGSYLFFLPLVVYLWRELRPKSGTLVDVASAAGLGYAIVGAIGAAVFVAAGEPLIRVYEHASVPDRAGIALTYRALSDAVIGIWQYGAAVLGGVSWIGIGLSARRRWPWFAWFSLALGAFGLLAVLGRAFGVVYESSLPATPAFLPLAVWPAWLGVLMLTDR